MAVSQGQLYTIHYMSTCIDNIDVLSFPDADENNDISINEIQGIVKPLRIC